MSLPRALQSLELKLEEITTVQAAIKSLRIPRQMLMKEK